MQGLVDCCRNFTFIFNLFNFEMILGLQKRCKCNTYPSPASPKANILPNHVQMKYANEEVNVGMWLLHELYV